MGVGAFFLVAAAAVLLLWNWQISRSAARGEATVGAIQSLLPPVVRAVPEERRDNSMPVLSVDGTDFVGLLEIPRYDSSFAVCNEGDNTHCYPRRIRGSIYNGTLTVGASTQKGQFDFYRELSVGDSVYYTDMEGYRYEFSITSMDYEKRVDQESLSAKEASLILVIQNIYSFESLVVYCNLA